MRIVLLALLVIIVCAGTIWAVPQPSSNVTAPENASPFLKDYAAPQPVAPQNSFLMFLGTLLRLLVTLVVISVLIYGTVFALRSWGRKYGLVPAASIGGLESVDSLPLGPHKTLYLVKVYDKKLVLIGTTEKDMQVIDRIEDAQAEDILKQVKAKWDAAKTFKEHFQDAQKGTLVQATFSKYVRDLKQAFVKKT